MSMAAESRYAAPHSALARRDRRQPGWIRIFFQAALSSLGGASEEIQEPQGLQARQEAAIAAARSAFGGTITW